MPELIAVKPLKYPRPLAAGDRFTVNESAARVLKIAGKARDAGTYAPRTMEAAAEQADEQQSGRRRRYQRRDLLAQE